MIVADMGDNIARYRHSMEKFDIKEVDELHFVLDVLNFSMVRL